MAERGYHLLGSEERKKQYVELMEDALRDYERRTYPKTIELFGAKREWVEAGFVKTIEGVKKNLQQAISAGKKGKIKYIQLSYLLSGAFSEEMLIRLDFYDKGYYRDVEEMSSYWDCSSLFPDAKEEYIRLKEWLEKRIIRIQSSELSQLKLGLMIFNYKILHSILPKLVKAERVEGLLRLCCENEAYVLYGAYLDQAEVIHQLGGEG